MLFDWIFKKFFTLSIYVNSHSNLNNIINLLRSCICVYFMKHYINYPWSFWKRKKEESIKIIAYVLTFLNNYFQHQQ